MKCVGLDQFERALFRRREEHVEGFDLRVQAPLLELRQHPLGVVLVVGRADVMRPRGEALHVIVQVLGAGNGAEHHFPVVLGTRRFRRVAAQNGRVRGGRKCGAPQESQTGQVQANLHEGKDINSGGPAASYVRTRTKKLHEPVDFVAPCST